MCVGGWLETIKCVNTEIDKNSSREQKKRRGVVNGYQSQIICRPIRDNTSSTGYVVEKVKRVNS